MIVITKFIKNWRSNDTECYNRTKWNVEYWLGRVFISSNKSTKPFVESLSHLTCISKQTAEQNLKWTVLRILCDSKLSSSSQFFFLLFNLYLTIYPAGHLVNFSNLNSQMDTQFQNTFQRKCPKKTLKLAERCSRKNQPRSREEDEPSGKRTMILSTYLRTVRKLRVSWQIIICEISKRRRDSNAELEKGNF